MKATTIPTVFIIDDDRGMRQAVQDLVESVGLLGVSRFANGQEFLAQTTATAGDELLWFLDVRLPHMSGLDFQSRRLIEVWYTNTYYIYYRARRRSHVRQGR